MEKMPEVGDRETFQKPSPLVWELTKLLDHRPPQAVWIKGAGPKNGVNETRYVFECVSSDPNQELAALKIKIIVSIDHDEKRFREVAQITDRNVKLEVDALAEFTQKGCHAVPKLFDTKEKHGENECIWYILEQKVPGVPLGSPPGAAIKNTLFRDMGPAKRELVRKAFESCWRECVRCGMMNNDTGKQNILWDDSKNKCYIVDWEIWDRIDPSQPPWNISTEMIMWNLNEDCSHIIV